MRHGAALAVALGLCACAGPGDEATAAGAVTDGVASSMEVQVASSSVRLVLHATNTGAEPLELTFPSSQRYDFIVRTESGDEVWRYSDGMGFLQALTEDTLPAGASWAMEATWDPGDRSGVYEAEGILTARDVEIRQVATFELR
jgi:hypothetical protein